MNANGFADLLSAKGVGLLAETFITELPAPGSSSQLDEAGGPNERVTLKGVHAFLKGYLSVTEAEASPRQPSTAVGSMASPTSQRVRSDVVHPLDMASHDNDNRNGDRATKINTIERLVGWCELQGIDFRGEFEQYDREYIGTVGAIEFKQVLLRLGLKQFVDPNASAEAIVGHLVREFRTPSSHDAVCYTAMLNQSTTSRIFHKGLGSCLPLCEELRARTRQRAKFTGKIDQVDPNIYVKLDTCFSHFDR